MMIDEFDKIYVKRNLSYKLSEFFFFSFYYTKNLKFKLKN